MESESESLQFYLFSLALSVALTPAAPASHACPPAAPRRRRRSCNGAADAVAQLLGDEGADRRCVLPACWAGARPFFEAHACAPCAAPTLPSYSSAHRRKLGNRRSDAGGEPGSDAPGKRRPELGMPQPRPLLPSLCLCRCMAAKRAHVAQCCRGFQALLVLWARAAERAVGVAERRLGVVLTSTPTPLPLLAGPSLRRFCLPPGTAGRTRICVI